MSDLYYWLPLTLTLLAFFLSHTLPALPGVRVRLIGLCGRRLYFFAYGVTSVLLLIGLVSAASSAPYVELWPHTDDLLWVPRIAMLPAIVLATNGLLAANPLSLTMNRRGSFDPERPGVVGLVRHPVLWATLIWSVSHIAANGALAHVVLFGTFALMSVQGMVAIDRRQQSSLGHPEWRRLAAHAPQWPRLRAIRARRPALSLRRLSPSLLGVVAYTALAMGHGWFAGVPAFL
jgi:uncharacterized membrane protein